MAEWPCCHDPLRFSPASLRFVPPPFDPQRPSGREVTPGTWANFLTFHRIAPVPAPTACPPRGVPRHGQRAPMPHATHTPMACPPRGVPPRGQRAPMLHATHTPMAAHPCHPRRQRRPTTGLPVATSFAKVRLKRACPCLPHPHVPWPPHGCPPCPRVPTCPSQTHIVPHNEVPKNHYGHIKAFPTLKTNFPCTWLHMCLCHPTTVPPCATASTHVSTSPSQTHFVPHNKLPINHVGYIRAFPTIKMNFPCIFYFF